MSQYHLLSVDRESGEQSTIDDVGPTAHHATLVALLTPKPGEGHTNWIPIKDDVAVFGFSQWRAVSYHSATAIN